MTLQDEIVTIDYMIKINPDSTIADYIIERSIFIALENEIAIVELKSA